MHDVDHLLGKADRSREDGDDHRPREGARDLEQKLDELRVVPCKLDAVRVLQQAGDRRDERCVGREQRGGVECIEVEADKEELVAEAEDEEGALGTGRNERVPDPRYRTRLTLSL